MEQMCVIFTPQQHRNILYAIGSLVSFNKFQKQKPKANKTPNKKPGSAEFFYTVLDQLIIARSATPQNNEAQYRWAHLVKSCEF